MDRVRRGVHGPGVSVFGSPVHASMRSLHLSCLRILKLKRLFLYLKFIMYTFQIKLRVFRKILGVISVFKLMKNVDFSLRFLIKGFIRQFIG